MSKCPIHPGSNAVYEWPIGSGKKYCSVCKTQIMAARQQVDIHVEPKDCFLIYAGSKKGWSPFVGTGCAHYVAHRLGLRAMGRQYPCLLGFPLRVEELATDSRLKKLSGPDRAQINDIWIGYVPHAHMGIVTGITDMPADAKTGKPAPRKITITHDSSGQGKVAQDEFAVRFESKGDFYRVSPTVFAVNMAASAVAAVAASPARTGR